MCNGEKESGGALFPLGWYIQRFAITSLLSVLYLSRVPSNTA